MGYLARFPVRGLVSHLSNITMWAEQGWQNEQCDANGEKAHGSRPYTKNYNNLRKARKGKVVFSRKDHTNWLSHVKEVVLYSANVFLQQIGSSACAVPSNIKREKTNSMTQSLKVMSWSTILLSILWIEDSYISSTENKQMGGRRGERMEESEHKGSG